MLSVQLRVTPSTVPVATENVSVTDKSGSRYSGSPLHCPEIFGILQKLVVTFKALQFAAQEIREKEHTLSENICLTRNH